MISITDILIFTAVMIVLLGISNPAMLKKLIPKKLPRIKVPKGTKREERIDVDESFHRGEIKYMKDRVVVDDTAEQKYNMIILSQDDYDAIKASQDYWQCAYCEAINFTTYTICQNCGAARRER